MQWSDLPLNPSTKTLRQFAGLWIAFFAGAALWQGLVRDRPTLGLALGAAALVVGPLGLAWPSLIRPIFVGWTVVVFPIGWVVSRLLLASVYYLVMTPLALVFRLTGRDALLLRRPAVASYWEPKPAAADARRYFRQF